MGVLRSDRGIHIPDASQSTCSGPQPYKTYCDKDASLTYKSCSPCTVEQLTSATLIHPEECEQYCPDSCPEGLNIAGGDLAPPSSCEDPTTSAPTTTGFTTHGLTSALTTPLSTINGGLIASVSNTTQVGKPTEATASPDPFGLNHRMLTIAVPLGVVVFALCSAAVIWVCVHRKRKQKNLSHSSSGQPFINDSTLEGIGLMNTARQITPPSSPVIDLTSGPFSVKVTAGDPSLMISIPCSCGPSEPQEIGADGATLGGLVPGLEYRLHIVKEGGGAGRVETFRTLGEPDMQLCMTLRELSVSVEGDTQRLMALDDVFKGIGPKHKALLRRLSTFLGVDHLNNVLDGKLFQEVLSVDSQHRESLSIFRLLEALQGPVQEEVENVEDCVREIVEMLSKVHPDCPYCRHKVCQVLPRNSAETAV